MEDPLSVLPPNSEYKTPDVPPRQGFPTTHQFGVCKGLIAFGPRLQSPSIKKWKHLTCGREAGRGRWDQVPLGDFPPDDQLNALYEQMGLDPQAVYASPDRRRINGGITSKTASRPCAFATSQTPLRSSTQMSRPSSSGVVEPSSNARARRSGAEVSVLWAWSQEWPSPAS